MMDKIFVDFGGFAHFLKEYNLNVQNEGGGAGGQRLKRCIIDLDRLSIALLFCTTCQVNVESMYVYRRQPSQYLY